MMQVAQQLGEISVEIDNEIAQRPTKRNRARLTVIKQIRTDNPELRVINKPWKRFILCVLYEMRVHPNSEFSRKMRDLRYEDRTFAEKMGAMSPDTVLRDSRELEIMGLFEKPDEHPDIEEG